jgi:hypothetical protein
VIRRALILSPLALLPLLAGCAALHRIEPDSAGVELTHVSHISQHAPISHWVGEPTTNFGYQTASLAISWYSRSRRWRFSMSDGYLLPSGYLPGPHEVFSASVGYTFWRRH